MQSEELIAGIRRKLAERGINLTGLIPYGECRIIGRNRFDFTPETVMMLAVPYLVRDREKRNISLYAVSEDYHLFFRELFGFISDTADRSGFHVAGYADVSPIDEVDAAVKSGLGIKGDNGLLITEKYGSYVFIGDIFTDAPMPEKDRKKEYKIHRCPSCGRCRRACVSPDSCLSMLTQKKGELSESERKLIKDSGCVWGCDMCQQACPLNDDVCETDIEFFRQGRLPYIDTLTIDGMPDEDFSRRAYSWRKKKTVLRNIEIVKDNT